jgi:hypothetical protein
MTVERSWQWRARGRCDLHPVLALLILNLAIWLALIGLVLAALCAMLAAAGR